MKKIIALALALIMALSMASVAFAADFAGDTTVTTLEVTGAYAPGSEITVSQWADKALKGYKVDYDFTTAKDGVDFQGASQVESVKINKDKDGVVLTLKESTKLLDDARPVVGEIYLTLKGEVQKTITVNITVNNNVAEVSGAKKAANAVDIGEELWDAGVDGNTVILMDEDGGYVTWTDGTITGTVKMDAEEKAFTGVSVTPDEDTLDAIEEAMGEDFDAIVEYYVITGNGFKNEVAFTYDAYSDDPHYFYGWDGEKLYDLGATYDDDEDVDDYVFSATGAGVLVITDAEIVLADEAEEETKNPDTGANDVVGVAAALAVVSLVAAGAVSLKK